MSYVPRGQSVRIADGTSPASVPHHPAATQTWLARSILKSSCRLGFSTPRFLSHPNIPMASPHSPIQRRHTVPTHLRNRPITMSRPVEDCEECPALAGVRNLGLDDPSADRPMTRHGIEAPVLGSAPAPGRPRSRRLLDPAGRRAKQPGELAGAGQNQSRSEPPNRKVASAACRP
jgi:hypothetical protein